MSLTLEQYIDYLDGRDYSWPAPPAVERPRVRPHLAHLPDVRLVAWDVYGTLLSISGGDLVFESPQEYMLDLALEKTIQEFRMWGSMSRKPGQPAEYLKPLYQYQLTQLRMVPGRGEKHPEIEADRLWEELVKRKLLPNGYQFDAGFYGSLNEFSRKVAYFFHSSMQGLTCYPGAADAVAAVAAMGLSQAVVGNGQNFTFAQLARCLKRQRPDAMPDAWLRAELSTLSYQVRARLPSERVFRRTLELLEEQGIRPDQVLHVGSRISQNIVPARRLGMRTALFAGDRASLEATQEQLTKPTMRPDVLLTDLPQLAEIVGHP